MAHRRQANINWAKHLRDQPKSGMSVAHYCEAHGILPHSFYAHRKAFLEAGKSDFVEIVPDMQAGGVCMKLTGDGRFRIEGNLQDLPIVKELLRGTA